MIRKAVSILFLSLFLLTQYGRQFAYLQCKIESFDSKSKAPVCDCEKKYDKDITGSDKVPPAKTHVHPSIDEYYLVDEDNEAGIADLSQAKKYQPNSPSLHSYCGNIYHPPKA